MPPGCCGDISIFAELEDAFDTVVQIRFKYAHFIKSNLVYLASYYTAGQKIKIFFKKTLEIKSIKKFFFVKLHFWQFS